VMEWLIPGCRSRGINPYPAKQHYANVDYFTNKKQIQSAASHSHVTITIKPRKNVSWISRESGATAQLPHSLISSVSSDEVAGLRANATKTSGMMPEQKASLTEIFSPSHEMPLAISKNIPWEFVRRREHADGAYSREAFTPVVNGRWEAGSVGGSFTEKTGESGDSMAR